MNYQHAQTLLWETSVQPCAEARTTAMHFHFLVLTRPPAGAAISHVNAAGAPARGGATRA